MLWVKNLIRRMKGKPPITEIYFDKDKHQDIDSAWESIRNHNQEAILIIVENKRNNKDYNKVTCHAKVSNDSVIIHMLPEILSQISENGS